MTTRQQSLTATIKRFLCSPRLIVGEIAALTLLCILGASVPQNGATAPASGPPLEECGPLVAALIQTFSLDHVFRSGWFLSFVLLTAASLSVLVLAQARRLCALWSLRLTPGHFRDAPLRAEFKRAARSRDGRPAATPTVEVWTKRRVGMAGSLVFHGGLLLVMVAGALRALFGVDAVVDLVEGETLGPTAQAWAAQWPAVLAKPMQLDRPITLEQVKAARYETGDLKGLSVRLALPEGDRVETIDLAVNHDAQVGGQRLFLANEYGATVLVEWQSNGRPVQRDAVLQVAEGAGSFAGTSAGPNNLRAHLRTLADREGRRPERIEVRVMKDNALLFVGNARNRDNIRLPGGENLVFHGTAFWARLRGSRDPGLWLAYAGFGLVMLGAATIFCVVRVDGCLVITPQGDQERVFLALRPQRFAAAYQEYFHRWVRDQGGPELGAAQALAEDGPPATVAAAATACVTAPRSPHVGAEIPMPSPRLAGWLLCAVCLTGLTGCQRGSVQEARQLVERYNRVVCEAYRRADVRLIDPVVGPNEGRKLTGLIGVRLDLGITLDAQLLALEVTGIEKSKSELRVRTKERWRYRDLKIGSGQPVGEESLDAYEMLYLFKKIDQAWMVDEIRFAAPPQIGRQQTPWIADRKDLHGIADPAREEVRQP